MSIPNETHDQNIRGTIHTLAGVNENGEATKSVKQIVGFFAGFKNNIHIFSKRKWHINS